MPPPSEALAETVEPQGAGAPAPPAETPEERDARPTLRDKMLTAIAEKAERLRREQIARMAVEVGGAESPTPTPPTTSESLAEATSSEAPPEARQPAEPDDTAEGEGDATPGQSLAAETAAPAEAASPSPPAAPGRRPIEINGVTYQLSDDELVHYAKVGAVTAAAMRQQPQAQPQTAPEPPKPPPAPRVAIDRERARSVVRSLAYGNEDEGAEALEKLVNELVAQPAEPPVSPQQIAAHAAALATQQVRLQQDLATIGAEFPEVFADLTRTRVATIALQDIVQRDMLFGNVRPDIDRMREAAQTVRAAMTPPAPAPRPAGNGVSAALQAAPTASPEADKLARKRAAPKTPTGTGHVASALQASRPATPSEIVAQMRKDRFQPSVR